MTRLCWLLLACSSSTAPPGPAANTGPIGTTGTMMNACPAPSMMGTEHNSNIDGSETWTAASSPHVVTSSFTVNGTLTLEPCVIVHMAKNTSITVNGTIIAAGTYDEATETVRPVVFTHAVEGEFWGQLDVRPTGLLDFTAAILGFGGSTDIPTVEATIEARGTQTLPVVKNLRMRGVMITDSAQSGVQVASYASFTDDSEQLIITRSGQLPDANPNFKSGFAVLIEPPGLATLPKGGTYTGNRRDAVYVHTRLQIPVSDGLPNIGIPYVFKAGGVGYYTNDQTSVTFTVEPGVTARFEKGSFIRVGDETNESSSSPGIFIANGTAEAPILFTSDAEVPAAGDWRGILIEHSVATGNSLKYVTIEYAGHPTQANGYGCGTASRDGGLIVSGQFWKPAAPFVQNSTFRHIWLAGIVGAWFHDPTPGDWKSTNAFQDITTPYTGDDGYACDVSKPGPAGPPCSPKGQCL